MPENRANLYLQEPTSSAKPETAKYGDLIIYKDGTLTTMNSANQEVPVTPITSHHTLTASRWQASGEAFVQVITLAASVVEDVTVEIGEVSEGMTLDKLEAIGAAMLTPTASTANTITVTAFGEKPEIDIPVFVTVFGLFRD